MEELVNIFKSCSDPARIRILNLLNMGELCVCHIVDTLQLPQSTISRHLSILKNAGIIQSRKVTVWHYYSLTGSLPESPVISAIIRERAKTESVLKNDLKQLEKCNCGPEASCQTNQNES